MLDIRELRRFLVVGVLSLVADAGSLLVLHGVAGMPLRPATALAFCIAFVINFGLNRLWAFQSDGTMGRQLGRYTALVLANLALTVVLVPGIAGLGVQYLLAKLITAAALFCANYVISRRWIFA